MKRYDIIVAGDFFVDLVFTGLPKLPELGEEVFGTGFEMLPGGSYNTVVAMHRLGLKVGWAADFGNDRFSRFVLDYAENEKLDPSLFVHHNQPLRHITASASFSQDRAFISYSDPEPAMPAAMKKLPFASSRALYIPALYYGRWFNAGLSLLRVKNMSLIMDGNASDVTLKNTPDAAKALQCTDLFLPNAREVRCLTGEQDLEKGIHMLLSLCPLVVVKDGIWGAYACDGSQLIHSPAIPVTPLDTTGAGDCFNAGFIKAWLDQRPLEECLKWGNIVGGLSTLALGGTGQVTTVKEVEEWLAKV